jgi:membrane-bound serine protease (ClpP class)
MNRTRVERRAKWSVLYGGLAAAVRGLRRAHLPGPIGFQRFGRPAVGRFGEVGRPAPNTFGRPAPNTFGRPAPNTFGRPAPNTFGRPAPNTLGRPAPNAWWRILCGGLLVLFVAGSVGRGAEDAAPASRAVLIRLEGAVTPLMQQFLERKLQVAEESGADVVIVEIESPGGLVKTSFDIAHRLRDLPWAQTVAFVPQQALSGAAIVALGCDRIIMAPNAVLGDAGPIVLGEDSLFRHAPEKIRTDMVLLIRQLAVAKGRPPALAEAMVDMNLVVFEVTNRQTGEKTFMSDHDIQASGDPGAWEKGPQIPESRAGYFLEVNGQRAAELRLAQGVAEDREALKRLLNLPPELRLLLPGAVDTAVFILNLPWVTGLLLVIGLVALYLEFHAPGISLGGLIAALCFALFFWSRFLGGTAEVLEIVLFLSGVVFLAVEIFVLPGTGVAGMAGILLMLAGVVMACQDFVVPVTGDQWETFSTTLLTIACAGAAFVAAAAWLRRSVDTLPMLKRLMLPPAPPALVPGAVGADGTGPRRDTAGPAAEGELAVGDRGRALSPLRPAGKAGFGGRYLDVITDGSFVERGRTVRIVEIRGSQIVVEEVESV